MDICMLCLQCISSSDSWTLDCEHAYHMKCLKKKSVFYCVKCLTVLSMDDVSQLRKSVYHLKTYKQLTQLKKVVKKSEHCVICLEEITIGRQLNNCVHVFHEFCLLKLIVNNLKCPLCRICIF